MAFLLDGVEAAFISSGLAIELGGELVTTGATELELIEEKNEDVENVVGTDDDIATDGSDEATLDGEAPPAPC